MKWNNLLMYVVALGLTGLWGCTNNEKKSNGDLNSDGRISRSDLDRMNELTEKGSFDSAGDLNHDGRLDGKDLEILKDLICQVNGGAIGDEGVCCSTSSEGTKCCDDSFDGDFSDCEPPAAFCSKNEDCSSINCLSYCSPERKCRCLGMCDSDEDCQVLNCPAYCTAGGNCECKIPCAEDLDCGFISKCPSGCGDQHYCVCQEPCLGAGERFIGVPDLAVCCSGLSLIEYATYVDGQCGSVNCPCFVCATCGDGQCGPGENPCNCEVDCPKTKCAPGETLPCQCENRYVENPPCSTCNADGEWVPIQYKADPCRCQNGPACAEGLVCDSSSGLCVESCLGEGEKFVDFKTEGKCCPGLVAVTDSFPDQNGGCADYNCPCQICVRCGTDAGVCGVGENRCNCPQDCVGAANCSASECVLVGNSFGIGGDCPGVPAPSMDWYTVTQDGCQLTFQGVLADLLGATACIDHQIIYTRDGCRGGVTIRGASRTIGLTCPIANNANTRDNCSVFLDDRID